MGANIFMPPTVVPVSFATSFVQLAEATGALPLEIEGVAKIGGEYSKDELPAQMVPLLKLDGSPRPKEMYGIGGLVVLNDILDMESGELVGTVGREDLERLDIDSANTDLIFGDGTAREMLADLKGTKKIGELGGAYFAIAMENGERHADDDLVAKLFFVSAALMAASPGFDMDGMNVFEQAADLAKVMGLPGKYNDPLNRDVKALIYENMAWSIDGGISPEMEGIRISRRIRAAESWSHWLAIVNYPDRHVDDATAMLVHDRILNGAQLAPDDMLRQLFTRAAPSLTFEDGVRNLIRSAWVQFMDDSFKFESDRWDTVSGMLLGAADLLRGDLEKVNQNGYLIESFSAEEYSDAFPDIDKAELVASVEKLSFAAVMSAEGARHEEAGI